MKILMLIPVVAYMALVVFNLDMLNTSNTINIFGLADFNAPALLYSSIFWILYTILVFIFFDIKLALKNRSINRLEEEIFELKTKLYDVREDEIREFIKDYKGNLDEFTQEQRELFEKFKSESERDLLKQKSETDRILEKLNILDKGFFDKIKETFKGKN
ncbi:hypothetical protein BKN14_02710 [Candidatus Gracilibacteria bacterium HOT-871]|nr:hypothetical protein BKN14_02710 [Candidatus Gracilibacteria bacterium HOT-871]